MTSIQPVGHQILSGVNIAGHTWNLWKGKHRSIFRPDSVLKCVRYVGPNSNWEVFSFVSSTGDLTDFSADLKDFFGECFPGRASMAFMRGSSDYLVQEQGVAATQVRRSSTRAYRVPL